MSSVTIIWSMVAATCFTLALGNGLVWSRRREARAHALFALLAVATAVSAIFELWMMRTETPREFGLALRWFHLPAWVLIVSLVGFVRLHLRAGRRWLAWAVVSLRTLSLILNFLFTPNLNYREITALRHIRFLGESVPVAVGVPNPWMLVGQTSFLLLAVFVVDALLTVWRRGDRRQSRWLAGTIVFFVLAGTAQTMLALWGVISMPLTTSLFFLGIVAAMGLEMTDAILGAWRLSDELRASEERMTLAAEAAGVGVWMYDIARNRVSASEKWLSLFGFALPEPVTFEMILRRAHPQDREQVEREVRRALAGQGDYVGEYRVILPDGTERWIASRGRMHRDASGKPARMLGATIEITQRKHAEAALKESDEHYRALFDRASEGICILSAEGKLADLNESFARMHGYSIEEMRGLNLDRLDTPETAQLAPERIRRILAGESLVFEVAHYHKDGHVFPLEVSASRINMAGGPCIQSFHRDITGRNRAQEALRESAERLRQAAEAAEFGIYRYDFAAGQAFYSSEFLGLYGLPDDGLLELDSDAVPKALHPDDKATFLTRMQAGNDPAGSGIFDAEYRILRLDGQVRWLRVRGRTVFTGEGAGRRPMRASGILQDVTARKQSEQEIEQQRNELAHLSRVNMLGELAGSLAHELNQPLTAILSNAQAAQRFLAQNPTELNEVRDILVDIVAEDKRAGEVIRRLRLLLNKGEVLHLPLSANKLAAEVLRLMRNDLVNQGVQPHTELGRDLPLVHGDRVQLQQVLINLVMNACDAMAGTPRENRRLTIRTRPGTGHTVCLSVADTGAGIAPDKLEQVFEPFYTTKAHGMGLGLAVCRTIIAAHGGNLWAESNPQGGATFHFTLPAENETDER